MASLASSLDNTASKQYVKSGLGGAGNYQLASSITSTATLPFPVSTSYNSTFTNGIGGAGNFHPTTAFPSLCAAESLKRDHLRRDHSPDSWHHGIGGAGNRSNRSAASSASLTNPSSSSSPSKLNKLKSRLASHIEARNARSSLFETWQRKLPVYPSSASSSFTTAAPVSMREKNYPALASCSSSTASSSDSLSSRISDLKDRAVWRLDRISAFGVDEGMRAAVPVYAKLDM